MRKVARAVGIGGMLAALLLAGGCKKNKDKPGAAPGKAAQNIEVKVPPSVLATVGMRKPGKMVDDGLVLVKKFVPLQFTRDSLLDMLILQAKLPKDLVKSVDMNKNMWNVLIEEKAAKQADAFVSAVPILDKAAFEKGLAQVMEPGEKAGELVQYKPKAGQVGMDTMWIKLTKTHCIMATTKEAYQAGGKYLETALLNKEPDHDVTVAVQMANVNAAYGTKIDEGVKDVMSQMQQEMEQQQAKSPVDQKAMTDATEKTVDHYLKLLRSSKELVFGLELDPDRVTFLLRARAQDKGELRDLIKAQRTGAPLAAKRLPASSWMVISDHGNPTALAKMQGIWEPVIKDMTEKADPKVGKAMTEAYKAMQEVFTGDSTTAMHTGVAGNGFAMSSVAAVKDGDKAKEAVDKLVDGLGALIKAKMAKEDEKVLDKAKFDKKPFAYKGAKGTLLELQMPEDAKKEKEYAMFEAMLGGKLTMGWAFLDKYALMTMGKDTGAHLKALVDGPETGKDLASKADFSTIVSSGNNRVGLVYISLLDAVKMLKGTGLDNNKVLGMLKGKTAKNAPFVDWGVDDDRTSLDLSLQLPADHFQAFGPVVQMLMSSGLSPDKLLGGGAPPMPKKAQ